MNDFTASNGIRVVDLGGKWDQSLFQFAGEIPGLVDDIRQVREVLFQDADINALREFFQAEADERLGRWRWPENPDYVVYPKGDGLFEVLRESAGLVLTSTVSGNAAFTDEHAQAARAYLAAHPEPKPWHDAKPGEVWALRLNDAEEELFYLHGDGQFHFRDGGSIPARLSITAGRRIWPEVQS